MKRGIIFALLAASLYGVNIVYARLATKAGIAPADLVFYRVLFLLAVCLPLLGRFSLPKSSIMPLLKLSIGSAFVGLAYFTAVKYISVSEAAPIFYTFPLWILILTPFVMKKPIDKRLYGLFALAFIGLCLIIGFSFQLPDIRGVIAALLASFAATAQFFTAKKASEGVNPLTLIFFVNMVILPIMLAISLMQGGPVHPTQLIPVGFPVFMVVAAYAAGFALQMEASKAAPPAVIGLVFCFEPVVALMTSALVLGESLQGVQLIGAGFVIVALVAASYLQIKRA